MNKFLSILVFTKSPKAETISTCDKDKIVVKLLVLFEVVLRKSDNNFIKKKNCDRNQEYKFIRWILTWVLTERNFNTDNSHKVIISKHKQLEVDTTNVTFMVHSYFVLLIDTQHKTDKMRYKNYK